MDKSVLYQQIAESIRHQIMEGDLKPNDRLPTVREMAETWRCTQGTVQRAYNELAREGLVISRPGQGTHIIETLSKESGSILRRAALINHAESFLLESLTAGYAPADVELALRLALDRWRAISREPSRPQGSDLRFAGSHDPAVALLASHYHNLVPDGILHLVFSGSLDGLMALARGEADLAGCHLWDAETDTYNIPFVRRLLPGQQVVLLTVAHRRLGLIVPKGNPARISKLDDVVNTRLRFATRQRGTGTRIWLDEHLHRLGLTFQQTTTFGDEKRTHYQVAQAITEREADAGIGVEAAALAYGLDFIYLTRERYDLIVAQTNWGHPSVQAIYRWLSTKQVKNAIEELGGYDISETGRIEKIE